MNFFLDFLLTGVAHWSDTKIVSLLFVGLVHKGLNEIYENPPTTLQEINILSLNHYTTYLDLYPPIANATATTNEIIIFLCNVKHKMSQ